MREVVCTEHLKFRMRIRKYPESLPNFYDGITRHYIAISRVPLGGKIREFAVSFDAGESIELITIHPLKKEQKEKRIATGRWKKMEEKEW